MKSYYTTINNQQIHFIKAGKGAPIVLFHASPQSAKMLSPFIQLLSQHFTVIAPDTPGYGESDPLKRTPKSLSAYCKFFHQFFKKLGLKKVAIYGTATGAQLAIRYGLLYPNKVSHLYLDNAAHFTEEQRKEILKDYFPDISPKYDGSHLLTVWTMVRDLFVFFPWCFATKQHRLKVPFLPASVLHQIALQYFQAGDHYALAYKAAFDHERAENIQGLKVPTSLFFWQGSIIKPYVKQLINQELPTTVKVKKIPADPSNRYELMRKHIINSYEGTDTSVDASAVTLQSKYKSSTIPAFIKKLPPLIPDENGAYLINAWFYLRDRQLYKDPSQKTVASINNRTPNFEARFLQQQLLFWMEQ